MTVGGRRHKREPSGL